MDLKKLYHDVNFSGSYSGAQNFYREVKNIYPKVSRKQINEFLKSQDTYTFHKRTRKPKYRRTLVFRPRDLWQIDLLDMQKYSTSNKDHRYICVIIDCFSRFVWVKPLKNKTGKEIVKALALLLMNERPKLIQADQGTEFFNKDVKRMLEAFGPKLYHTYTDKKAAIVERVQRTLRGRLGRLFTKRKNFKWIDKIDDIVTAYNNSHHRSIDMKPAEVDQHHIANLFFKSIPDSKKTKKFSTEENVRILVKKGQFTKEFEKSWTEEIFKIKKVQSTNPITYLIKDQMGEEILGGFYAEELQSV
tara:strand:- start:413 stop:1318 length:906 start_codon:yes stop_codon:yes gene_type:complete